MESLIINGGNKLGGRVRLSAAKNAVLPIIACCIMSKREIVIKNCPKITDIMCMINIINSIGGEAYFDGGDIVINCRDANPQNVDKSLTKCMRSSVFILGPILARFKKACISYPGGCDIGSRPIDLHIRGLKTLGTRIFEHDNIIECDGRDLAGGELTLSLPSVGATENIMMAAVLISGTTTIKNAAKEPEIVDLANFINYLGGRVSGAGSSTIVIEGVKELGGGEYTPIPDRIVAGTIMAGCAAVGGRVVIENYRNEHVKSILDVLCSAGCGFYEEKDSLIVESNGILRAVGRLQTKPYPYFPTDMQPQIMAMLSVASGKSFIEENLFENRFRHVAELEKMGANLRVFGKEVEITGVKSLHGADVLSIDLRGGAALVIAGAIAEGTTHVSGVCHIDRGYENIENIFGSLGVDIKRCFSNH